jgi:hypothetical protein
VRGVRCQRMQSNKPFAMSGANGEPDDKSHSNPVPRPDTEFDLAVSAVLVA